MEKETLRILEEINKSLKVISNNSERPVNVNKKEKLKELIKSDEKISISDVISQIIECL